MIHVVDIKAGYNSVWSETKKKREQASDRERASGTLVILGSTTND